MYMYNVQEKNLKMEDFRYKIFIYLVLLTIPLEIATTYEKVATECFGKGNIHDMNCNGTERYMITGLLYGAKNFTQRGNTTCSFRDTNQDKDVCCSFDDGDCLFEIQDFSNRYKYLYEFSGDTVRSRTITTEHHRALRCNVEMEFSNYVAIKYDCMKDKELVHICDAYSGIFHGEVYIFTNPRGTPRDFCECRVESESKNPLSVYAVDIRLQHSGEQNGSCTENNNNFTISDINNDTTLECEDGKAYGQLERIFDASQGIVNVTLNQEKINGSIARSQMVWIKINATSNSSFDVTCNRRLFTTTLSTTDATTSTDLENHKGSTDSSTNNSKPAASERTPMTTSTSTKRQTTIKTTTTESTEQRRLRRVYFRNLADLGLVFMLALVALLAMVIIIVGIYIRRRRNVRI